MAQRNPREESPVRVGVERPLWGVLLVAVAGAGLIGLLYLILSAFDGAHNGEIAGNEAMAVAAALGLSGLVLVIADRRLDHLYVRILARILLAGGLVYLLMGALLGNGRWALLEYRALGYLGALGGVWLSEYLLEQRQRRPGAVVHREEADVNGLLSLAAAGTGFYAARFEVVRWLEPVFRLAAGELITPEQFAHQEATRALLTLLVWSLYCLLLLAVGVRLGSPPTRRLAHWLVVGTIGFGLLVCLPRYPAANGVLAAVAALAALAALAAAGWSRLRYRSARQPG